METERPRARKTPAARRAKALSTLAPPRTNADFPREVLPLIREAREAAHSLRLAVDRDVYVAAGADPAEPLLYGGDLNAPLAILGRDPGRTEIQRWEPLIGSGGKLVRGGLGRAERTALLTNTVPYKPIGNVAWKPAIRERFRPLIAALLVDHWAGHVVLTLGTEAFQWFTLGASPKDQARAAEFWAREDRYEQDFRITLRSERTGAAKEIRVAPLPHPSPLNVRWFKKFPALFDLRMRGL